MPFAGNGRRIRGLPGWRFRLSLVLQFLGHFVPVPKDLPMDRLFRTSFDAWILAVFGVLIAPLMEELFFRGFLYPVLARRLGYILSIVLTGLRFALVHAQQLGQPGARC